MKYSYLIFPIFKLDSTDVMFCSNETEALPEIDNIKSNLFIWFISSFRPFVFIIVFCVYVQGTAEVDVQQDLQMHSMKIYVCHEPDALGIIIEGHHHHPSAYWCGQCGQSMLPSSWLYILSKPGVSFKTGQNLWSLWKTVCGTGHIASKTNF